MNQSHDEDPWLGTLERDRKSTRLNSSHPSISYAVFCLKKKNNHDERTGVYDKKHKEGQGAGECICNAIARQSAYHCAGNAADHFDKHRLDADELVMQYV